MYYTPWVYLYPYQPNVYCANVPMYNNYIRQHDYWNIYDEGRKKVKDYGRQPFVVNINEASKHNNTYRTALWTGNHLQVTLMSINVGEDIGLEIHPHIDQFLRI